MAAIATTAAAQEPRFPDPYAGQKKVLVVADLHTGNQIAHDAVSHAIATLERLGRESGAYVAFLRTDTTLVTKGEVWGTGDYAKGGPRAARGRNLDYFDAVVFYTNGETEMTAQQKADLLAFVRDDGKGFVAVHTATASFSSWPEYGAMVGGFFENHPWNVFDAPVIVERPDFPAMQHLPRELVLRDEMYQYRAPYSRANVDVLARLDERKLDLTNPNVKRTDQRLSGRVDQNATGTGASSRRRWVTPMRRGTMRACRGSISRGSSGCCA